MIKVESRIDAYEINGSIDHTPIGKQRPGVIIRSHALHDHMVVVEPADGKGQSMTFLARDLEAAIANAKNRA